METGPENKAEVVARDGGGCCRIRAMATASAAETMIIRRIIKATSRRFRLDSWGRLAAGSKSGFIVVRVLLPIAVSFILQQAPRDMESIKTSQGSESDLNAEQPLAAPIDIVKF